ncbi:hypothetical protein C0J52_14312 [Blattella germanica]|nr:hypothetical protein C0J52_14312 [Blattella germanica]
MWKRWTNGMETVKYQTTFHVNAHINRHKCPIWADKPPTDFIELIVIRDSSKTNAWLGITQPKTFFRETPLTVLLTWIC